MILELAELHRLASERLLTMLKSTYVDSWDLRQLIWESSLDWIIQQGNCDDLLRMPVGDISRAVAELDHDSGALRAQFEKGAVLLSSPWKDIV